jgi:hypothetical protein
MLKLTLSLALAVVACACAVIAAPASAETLFESRGGTYQAKIEATGKNMTFTGESSTVKCAKSKLTTVMKEDTPVLKVSPSYEECTGEVLGVKTPVTTTVKECTYTLLEPQPAKTTEFEDKEFKGQIEIAGSKCVITITPKEFKECTVTIEKQGPLKGIIYKDNLATEGEETLETTNNIEAVKYKVTKCIGLKEGEHSDGKLEESTKSAGMVWGGPGAQQTSPDPVDFGAIGAMGATTQNVTLRNTTGTARTIKAIGVELITGTNVYECTNLPLTVPANGQATATLKFAPPTAGRYRAAIGFQEEVSPGVFTTRWTVMVKGQAV